MELLKNAWKPDKHFKFPKTVKGKCFQYFWFSKTEFSLAYSPIVDGAFCLTCVLFGDTTGERNANKLSHLFREPYNDWGNALRDFRAHKKKSPVHSLAEESN